MRDVPRDGPTCARPGQPLPAEVRWLRRAGTSATTAIDRSLAVHANHVPFARRHPPGQKLLEHLPGTVQPVALDDPE